MATRLPEAEAKQAVKGQTAGRAETTVGLEGARRQKTAQAVLPLGARGKAPEDQRSGEAPKAASGNGRSGNDCLIERVVERGNAKAALKRVRQNKGSPGVDGMTVDELPKYLVENWPTLREQLLAGTYQPKPVREVEIPKSGGGVRKLGIPTALDRFIQQSILQVLQPMLDPTFSEHSHGFRPGRNAHDAVCEAQRYIQDEKRVVVEHRGRRRGVAQLPAGMETVFPPGGDAEGAPRTGQVDSSPPAHGPAQAVEEGQDRLPRAAQSRGARDVGRRGRGQRLWWKNAGHLIAVVFPISYYTEKGVPRLAG
jgi:hypothetical protein